MDSVTVDNVSAASRCMEHLLECGHRRIAIVNGSLLLQTPRSRLEGLQNSLTNRRIQIDDCEATQSHRNYCRFALAGDETAYWKKNELGARCLGQGQREKLQTARNAEFVEDVEKAVLQRKVTHPGVLRDFAIGQALSQVFHNLKLTRGEPA